MATPFVAYFYLTMLAMSMGVTLPEVLEKTPNIAVILLVSMINPYIAYLLHLSQKKLKDGDVKFACINFVLLLVAQALTLNTFYLIMVAVVFYKTVKTYEIQVLKTLKEFTIKHTFALGGGSFIVVALSSICLMATIRLM